jgi:hypothetical protein
VTCTDTPIIDDPRSPEHNVDQMVIFKNLEIDFFIFLFFLKKNLKNLNQSQMGIAFSADEHFDRLCKAPSEKLRNQQHHVHYGRRLSLHVRY